MQSQVRRGSCKRTLLMQTGKTPLHNSWSDPCTEKRTLSFTRNLLNYRVPNGNVEIELLVYLLGLVIEATNKCYRYDYDTIASLLSNDELIYTPMNASESNKIKIDIKNQMNDQLRVFNANKN